MTKLRVLSFASLILLGGALPGASQAPTGLRQGFAVDRLARIDGWLQQYVDSNRIAGAVLLVMRDGNVVYEKAVGWADKESQRRMTPDAMFRIASQTKALTSVAIMMLVEEGKIALNDPVSRFIPAYANTTVIGPERSLGRARERITAVREITIRDLLTHTAGIPYGTDTVLGPIWSAKGLGPATGTGFYLADKDEPVCTTMETLATLPFTSQPGERFVYGWSTDVLGCVVERVSRISLADFFRTRITEPLGMTDTHFFVPPAKAGRLVTVYASSTSGHAMRAPDGQRGQGHYADGPRKNYSGGAGLVSTAADYAKFSRMLLNGGELNGRRLLAPGTVRLMSTNQIDTLYRSRGKGFGFGLGFEVMMVPGSDLALASPGTYGWGGAYGSFYRIDPEKRIVLIFMLNQIPNRNDIREKVTTMVYQALVK
jgi:CubicO group peptidase (beta-lactamase class C family)